MAPKEFFLGTNEQKKQSNIENLCYNVFYQPFLFLCVVVAAASVNSVIERYCSH